MVQLNNTNKSISRPFTITSILLLIVGMLFGIMGSLQYIIPGLLKEQLSFEKIRPMHVSSIIFWIIIGSVGSVFNYLQLHTQKKLYSRMLAKATFFIFSISIIVILFSYCFGIFGGREYWEFNPIIALPIFIGWILFMINFIKSIGSFRNQPVYVWMWLTGIFFFLFTFLESYLWLFPYFRNNIVNDMTIQWKSYGSMVGSWNMLLYGSSIFLMEKISDEKKYSSSPIAFALYFIGLFNLMFNWGHHIYTLPTYPFIKNISYLVSMTELLILGRIIFLWKSTLTKNLKHINSITYRLILAADVWIFSTLLLAIAMSIPAINIYTHGTHITVAHTMGATIGINSFLLLAISFDILATHHNNDIGNKKYVNLGFWMTNISLFIFWISLIIAGIIKSKWQMTLNKEPFSTMMLQLKPFFIVFCISGMALFTGFILVISSLIKYHIFYKRK